jgi:hypothetical protein
MFQNRHVAVTKQHQYTVFVRRLCRQDIVKDPQVTAYHHIDRISGPLLSLVVKAPEPDNGHAYDATLRDQPFAGSFPVSCWSILQNHRHHTMLYTACSNNYRGFCLPGLVLFHILSIQGYFFAFSSAKLDASTAYTVGRFSSLARR